MIADCKKRPEIFILEDPIYNSGIMVQFGGDINDLLKEYAKKLKQDVPKKEDNWRGLGNFTAYEHHKGGALWIKNRKDHSTISHECLHATFHVMTRMGMPLVEASEEAWAYYLGWLVKEIHNL